MHRLARPCAFGSCRFSLDVHASRAFQEILRRMDEELAACIRTEPRRELPPPSSALSLAATELRAFATS